jgi:hypothetical protein
LIRGAAVRAAREVRQVTRKPEQLQLERERERIERRPRKTFGQLIDEVEETSDRSERSGIPLLLGEQTQHRLCADQPDPEAVSHVTRRVVRAHQIDPGNRLELPGPLVQKHVDVRERLETCAEAGLRLPDALRDGTNPTAIKGVQVEHAIRLAEAKRAQDDGLGLIGTSPRHGLFSLERALARTSGRPRDVGVSMARIQMYTTRWCGYCVRAKTLLQSKGVEFEEISLDGDPTFRQNLF